MCRAYQVVGNLYCSDGLACRRYATFMGCMVTNLRQPGHNIVLGYRRQAAQHQFCIAGKQLTKSIGAAYRPIYIVEAPTLSLQTVRDCPSERDFSSSGGVDYSSAVVRLREFPYRQHQIAMIIL